MPKRHPAPRGSWVPALVPTLVLALVLALSGTAALAAVDANRASQAELESVKGLGPALSARIVQARRERAFSDWPDFIARVKGVGAAAAARYSAAGLTVGGAPYPAASAPGRAR